MSSEGQSGEPVVVVGAYSEGNLGDIVLLMKTVDIVRTCLPGAALSVVSEREPFLERLLPGIRFIDANAIVPPRGRLRVYGGGTQFFAFENTDARASRRLANALRSPRRLARGLLRRALKRTSSFGHEAALGIGIGSFVPGSWREEHARRIFKSLGYVAVRDQASLEQCTRWGLSQVKLRADLCFCSGGLSGLQVPPHPPAGQRSLAVIVRTWRHSEAGAAYVDPLLATTAELTREGWTATFFSFCEKEDRPLNDRLRAEGYEVASWDPLRESPAEFVTRLAAHQVVVSARFHGALFAGLLGKPCIAVELEPKLRIAATTLATPELVWAQPFDRVELRRLIGGLASNQEEAAARVAAAVLIQKALADQMVREFAEYARSWVTTACRSGRRC